MQQVESLQYGVMFKKAFSKPSIFKAFVKDCLGIELDIETVETEKSFSPVIGKIDTCFDLFAEDEKQRIIVEIQHVKNSDHYERFLYYHCVAILEQATKSKTYKSESNVYTIVILTSGDKHKTDMLEIDFDPKNRDGKGVGEINHKLLFFCPKYINDKTPEPFREWLKAIDDSLDNNIDESKYHNTNIQEIFNIIKEDNISPQELAKMKEEYSLEEYKQKEIEEKKEEWLLEGLEKGLEKGIEVGMQEGLEKGKEEGLQEGLEKGMQEGEKKKQIEIAKNLLLANVDISIIIQTTGLTKEEIEELKY